MARRKGKTSAARQGDTGWSAWLLGSAHGAGGYFAQSRSLALSFVLIAPLLFVYEFALLYYPPARGNAAGQFLRDLLAAMFHTRAGAVLNLIVALLLVLAVVVLARRGRLRLELVFPMIVESAAWAAVLVGLAVLICHRLAWVLPNQVGSELAQNLIGSVGAGVYEEIVFRLLLTSALYVAGLKIFEGRHGHALLFSALLGAMVFAGCHRPTTLTHLIFYFVSGVFFAVLYARRGLGVAVYTHVIYDIVAYLARG